MAWTNQQKQIAARACAAAGIHDEHRLLLLRQLPHSVHHGRVTSTSPALTNADFEQFMARVEHIAGGKVLHFSQGYWQDKAGDETQRMRHAAQDMERALREAGLLGPGGIASWIDRATGGRTENLAAMTFREMHNLINGMREFGRRHGLFLPDRDPVRATGVSGSQP